MKSQTLDEWFAKTIKETDPEKCWNASGGGYNKRGWHVAFKSGGVRYLAHRAAWSMENGAIPTGMSVLHRCDNPKCCNPKHLFLGTQSENALDMWEKGRAKPGSNRGQTLGPSIRRRLDDAGVLRLFALFLAGNSQRHIAQQLGITDVAVSCVLTGKTYPEFAKQREGIQHLLGRGVKKKIQAATRAVHRRLTFQAEPVNQPELADLDF